MGVTGGGIGVSVFRTLRFGVEGAVISLSSAVTSFVGAGEAFLLRDLDAGPAGGGIAAVVTGDGASTGFASARALSRADLRVIIVKFFRGTATCDNKSAEERKIEPECFTG